MTRGQKAAQTRKANEVKSQITAGVSDNIRVAIDREWSDTERSNAAEEALLREYHYHALRCEELKNFLMGVGIVMPGWES